jgi:hypothetical protein
MALAYLTPVQYIVSRSIVFEEWRRGALPDFRGYLSVAQRGAEYFIHR